MYVCHCMYINYVRVDHLVLNNQLGSASLGLTKSSSQHSHLPFSSLSSGGDHEIHTSMLSCLFVCSQLGPVRAAVFLRYQEWSCPAISRRHNLSKFPGPMVLKIHLDIKIPWYSLSIRCTDCTVDFSGGTKHPMFTFSLQFGICGFL